MVYPGIATWVIGPTQSNHGWSWRSSELQKRIQAFHSRWAPPKTPVSHTLRQKRWEYISISIVDKPVHVRLDPSREPCHHAKLAEPNCTGFGTDTMFLAYMNVRNEKSALHRTFWALKRWEKIWREDLARKIRRLLPSRKRKENVQRHPSRWKTKPTWMRVELER